MLIAKQKRAENIAEYILYIWQLEDLFRALQFSPEAIYRHIVVPQNLSENDSVAVFEWYMQLITLLKEENKEDIGHLDHTLHLISELNGFHLQLLNLPVGKEYKKLFEKLQPELVNLRAKLKKSDDISDIELCFRALYSVVLYRIKGVDNNKKSDIDDVITLISPVIGLLSKLHGEAERGEINLFEKE